MLGRSLSLAVLLALVALAAGCNDGDETPSASPTPLLTATATPVPATATPVPDIQDEDLTQHPALQDLIASGGEVDASRIIYVDLTEDGVDDAVVPISSGGTGGDLAVVVLGYGPDGLGELLRALPRETRSIRATVQGGQLVTTEGVYGPNDALCCPSQILTKWYAWDGSELAIDRQETAQD
ncbi:MAG: hypothetical protein IIC88_02605 [Chloroflexi bacterium]|nr:hypothetical protein [Chloroflexota bacterium]